MFQRMLVVYMNKDSMISVRKCVHHTGVHGIQYVETYLDFFFQTVGETCAENSIKCPICWGNGFINIFNIILIISYVIWLNSVMTYS